MKFWILLEKDHEEVKEKLKSLTAIEWKTMNASQSSWVEINLFTLCNNLKLYSNHLCDTTNITAVVKADACGHGDKVIAKFLSDHDVRHFAVANIDEVIHLRTAGVEVADFDSGLYSNRPSRRIN